MFALGNSSGTKLTLGSSSPDLRATVAGSSLIFTAAITAPLPALAGTITFTDLTYNGLDPVTTTLAANVPVDPTKMNPPFAAVVDVTTLLRVRRPTSACVGDVPLWALVNAVVVRVVVEASAVRAFFSNSEAVLEVGA